MKFSVRVSSHRESALLCPGVVNIINLTRDLTGIFISRHRIFIGDRLTNVYGFAQSFAPMQRIRFINPEFRLNFNLIITAENIKLLDVYKE
jgi:hypothetical protein